MAKKLSKDELLKEAKEVFDFYCGNLRDYPSEVIVKQAYQQIVALIKKPKVTGKETNMIRTKDLEEFLKSKEIRTIYHNEVEYIAEIVARLRAYDKLKESIEKLIATISSGVD